MTKNIKTKKNTSYSALLLLWIFAAIILTPLHVFAQEKVTVRIGKHATYTRIVFDWPRSVAYHTIQRGQTVHVLFDAPAALDLAGINFSKTPLVTSIKTVDEDKTRGEALHLEIGVEAKTSHKHFRAGSKVVIDILGSNYTAETKPKPEPKKESPKPKPAAKQSTTQKKEEKKVTPVEDTPPSKYKPETISSVREEAPAPKPVKVTPVTKTEIEEAPKPDPLPVMNNQGAKHPWHGSYISFSTLNPTGLAVFERFGKLFIILDKPHEGIAPRVFGPAADDMGQAIPIDAQDGAVYALNLPEGLHPHISGTPLKWRITLKSQNLSSRDRRIFSTELDSLGQTSYLVAQLKRPSNPVKFVDPTNGDEITAIPSMDADNGIPLNVNLVDLDVISAAQGLVFIALSDELRITPEKNTVQISSPNGLNVSPDLNKMALFTDPGDQKEPVRRIFDMVNWHSGGLENFRDNKFLLEERIVSSSGHRRIASIIELAQLYFANGMGAESVGLLKLAAFEDPDLEKNIEYLALRGAASALAGDYDAAMKDLSIRELENEPEANMWRGYAAAISEFWSEAYEAFPETSRLITTYPPKLAHRLNLYMTEAALRAGNVQRAQNLIGYLDAIQDTMTDNHAAAHRYLSGEYQRQLGNPKLAKKLWRPLTKAPDRLYRAKASLALLGLELQEKSISPEKAINELERLRFAWRGDSIESQTMHQLGKLYLSQKKYQEGFSMLRRAASLKVRNSNSQQIAADMSEAFAKLYVQGEADKLPPLEALAIYNEFSELTPVGPEGDKAIRRLAERLVEIDLLGRAAKLLEHQLEYRVEGKEASSTGAQLANIYLLDSDADNALQALNKSQNPTNDARLIAERNLLRARALSLNGQPNDAIAILAGDNSRNAEYLRVDIYWRSSQWNKAALVLKRLIHQRPKETKELSDEEAQNILNLAIAYKLSGQLSDLYSLKDKYGILMSQSKKAKLFNVVTRPPGRDSLSDRETLKALVSEVDMFKGFLDNYKSNQ